MTVRILSGFEIRGEQAADAKWSKQEARKIIRVREIHWGAPCGGNFSHRIAGCDFDGRSGREAAERPWNPSSETGHKRGPWSRRKRGVPAENFIAAKPR